MPSHKSWVLTDVDAGVHVETWTLNAADLGLSTPNSWSIRKRRLHGGLCEGVDVIEVDNGATSFTVVPTRGMGIHRGASRGVELGWRSPVRGPVHPGFVDETILGGIGWLGGFDEWIVRCGLGSNGAPGVDTLTDNNGNPREMTLPLHGRIANLPAHYVEVRVDLDPPHGIQVIGEVDEAMLFFPQLRLSTVIETTPGANSFRIRDAVTNLGSQPAELQMLYHCNFGPPLLGAGSRLLAPAAVMAPRGPMPQKEIEDYARFPGPIPGVVESAFFFELLDDPATGRTVVALADPKGNRACALRFSKRQLPWFTLWKNPGAESDGYVTGLEPATNLPNHKTFERAKGRVVELPGGGAYEMDLEVEVAHSSDAVAELKREIERLQAATTLTMHAGPISEYTQTD